MGNGSQKDHAKAWETEPMSGNAEQMSHFAITVCIPLYNVEKWLSECLDSVVVQSIWHKVFVIIIDDGSQDAGPDIAREFCGHYPEQTQLIYHGANKGTLATRYTAIAELRTPYAMFLDSDDLLPPNACELLYQTITAKQADMIMGRSVWKKKEHKTIMFPSNMYTQTYFDRYGEERNLCHCGNYSVGALQIWGKIYRSELLKLSLDGQLPAISWGEDKLFSVFIFAKAQRFFLLKQETHWRRKNVGSATESYSVMRTAHYLLCSLGLYRKAGQMRSGKLRREARSVRKHLQQPSEAISDPAERQKALALLADFDRQIPLRPASEELQNLEEKLLEEFGIPRLGDILELPEYVFYDASPAPPKCSIIIPVYNTRDYLAACLESVCLQSETAIEIIVVDDASPDDSWDMIQNYARRDTRIVPLRHEQNKGAGGARNTGIEAARSEWLLFLDSDDYIARNTVEVFLHKVSEYPQAELLVCGVVRVCDGKFSNYGGAPRSDLLINQPFEHYRHTRQPELFHCAWAKLWRRKLFTQSGLRFPEHMSAQDFALVPRLLYYMQSKETLFIPERLFYYQYRFGSLNNGRSKIAVQGLTGAVGILNGWGKTLEGSESHFLRHKVGKEVERWLARYSGDGELLAELINALPAHYTARYILQIAQRERDLQADCWYRFGQLSRKHKLWMLGKMLSKKLGLYKPLRLLLIIAGKVMRKLGKWIRHP